MWRIVLIPAFMLVLVTAATAQPRGKAGENDPLPPEVRALVTAFEQLDKADILFTATLSEVTEGPTAVSQPPIRSYLLKLTGVTAKRGKVPDTIELLYSIRSKDSPLFATNQTYTVGAKMVGDAMRIEVLIPAPAVHEKQSDTK